MEQNLKERIEPNLQRQLKPRLEEAEKRIGLSDLDIPPEVFRELKRRQDEELTLMYQHGKDDHHQLIKEMYERDVDDIIEMFEPNE